MPSLIYQYVIYLVVRSQGIFVNVAMQEHCTLDDQIFYMAKFTALTPLSLLISCKLLFPVVGLKISSLPTFAFRSPNKIFKWYFGN
jgi:hypothetical protein